MNPKSSFPILACALTLAAAPKADAALTAYIHILDGNGDGDRLHISEVEAFIGNVIPNQLGGGDANISLNSSTNDIGGLVAYGVGNVFPLLGTNGGTDIQHGGANQNPNNVLEQAGAVWSTQPDIPGEGQYTLDLGGLVDVTTVHIFPRADNCCVNRFTNLTVTLYDNSGPGGAPGAIVQQFTAQGPGTGPGGNPQDVLVYNLAAVPEPSSIALLGLASSAFLLRRRRL